jgi:hypothetical protein
MIGVFVSDRAVTDKYNVYCVILRGKRQSEEDDKEDRERCRKVMARNSVYVCDRGGGGACV